MLAYISGDGFGIPKILDKPIALRAFQRTFASLAFILPDKRFWQDQEVNFHRQILSLKLMHLKRITIFCLFYEIKIF